MAANGELAQVDAEINALLKKRAAILEAGGAAPGATPFCPEPLFHGLPPSVLTDSYKAAHFAQYPAAKKMVAYGAFRKPYKNRDGMPHDPDDSRLLFFGIRYLVETYLNRKWTLEDVERAAHFYSTHNAGYTPYPFPRDLFEKFVRENGGFFPVKVEALPEGSVVHAGCPVLQITAEEPYAHLCTFMETILTHVWYPTSVATLSRRAKDVIEEAFDRTVDEGRAHPLVTTKLHDFGMRGCTCVEQSVIGGTAHLLNFEGTDTMSAAYYGQFALNGGRPVAASVPATEHSVMTSWPTEKDAMQNMCDKFGDGVFSMVMDSYDYDNAINNLVPQVAGTVKQKGGFLVLRPDSGDPVETVLAGLRAAERAFGADVNKKGFKTPRGCSVLQGDGIDLETLKKILAAVEKEGYSALGVTFGMGGGLLQKVNRDTMSFATKLCHIHYATGVRHDIMKAPLTDAGKYSLPGILEVRRDEATHVPMISSVPDDGAGAPMGAAENMLKVVYDKGPVKGHRWETLDEVRARVREQWPRTPKKADNVTADLKERAQKVAARLHSTVTRG